MKKVKAKKQLGQHFLTDNQIAQDTVDAFNCDQSFRETIEVGPGMGVLSKLLQERDDIQLKVIDIDTESIAYLKDADWIENNQIIEGDFLHLDLKKLVQNKPFGVIGNFPYNISTQILFKVLEHKHQVKEVVGMFQKEVAKRVVSKEGSKIYGITSVLLQAYYEADYLFTVNEDVFDPPPKVKSAVIRLKRNNVQKLDCDEKLFKSIVKSAFNLRRKTLRNSLKPFLKDSIKSKTIFDKRPEQLSVSEFIGLTQLIQSQ